MTSRIYLPRREVHLVKRLSRRTLLCNMYTLKCPTEMLKSWIVQQGSFLVTSNHRIRFVLRNGTVLNKNLLVGLFDSAKKLWTFVKFRKYCLWHDHSRRSRHEQKKTPKSYTGYCLVLSYLTWAKIMLYDTK